MASCVLRHPKWFGRPKTTCRSPEGSGQAPLQSRCAWKRKNRNKKRKNERCNIQICFQEMGTAENMNAIYPCFQSIVNRIFSSFGIVSRDLFSATVRLVRGVRCIFAGLWWWIPSLYSRLSMVIWQGQSPYSQTLFDRRYWGPEVPTKEFPWPARHVWSGSATPAHCPASDR